ncbi:MAG: hypothetical protein GX963_01085 [Bacteroidales bacterium]|nr:hypothetical protein [Bacteroidales bacterium]
MIFDKLVIVNELGSSRFEIIMGVIHCSLYKGFIRIMLWFGDENIPSSELFFLLKFLLVNLTEKNI